MKGIGKLPTTRHFLTPVSDHFIQYIYLKNILCTGAIWGAIAPARFWGPESIYSSFLWCFIIGFCIPFIPFFIHQYIYPSKYWILINFPLLFSTPGAAYYQNYIVSPMVVGFVCQVVIFRYANDFYKRYNYVLGAGLDGGVALCILIVSVLGLCGITWSYYNELHPKSESDYYCVYNKTFLD